MTLLAGKQRPDDADSLVEPVEALAEPASKVNGVRPVLLLEPAAADAENDPAAADVIDRGDDLGEQRRRTEHVGRHQRSELQPLGGGGKCRQGRPGLEHRLVGLAIDRQEMVPDPQMVVAQFVGEAGGLQNIGPLEGLIPQADPEPQRRSGVGGFVGGMVTHGVLLRYRAAQIR